MNPNALEIAFLTTTYRVETPGGVFDLRIASSNAGFDDFLAREGVSHWGIVTAFNPGAQQLSADENQLRHHRLLSSIAERGWSVCPAINIPDHDDWPPEPGCLLLQVDEQALRGLAADFGQVALVYGEACSAPRLIWC